MRTILILAAALAIVLCDVGHGDAYYGYGPWCAVQSIGAGIVTENCSMQSFEQCRLEVIAGNRGWCQPNPYWAGPHDAGVGTPLKRRRPARH